MRPEQAGTPSGGMARTSRHDECHLKRLTLGTSSTSGPQAL
jgi:hypothetical protein